MTPTTPKDRAAAVRAISARACDVPGLVRLAEAFLHTDPVGRMALQAVAERMREIDS